jgi:hypothetical protein
MSDTPTPAPKKPARKGRLYLSYLLFALSAALFAVVAWLYIEDRNTPDAPPVPTAIAGANEAKDVFGALNDAGLKAEYGRTADRAIGLTEVAQAIVIDGATAYIFVYPDVAQRERDTARVDASQLSVVNTRGTPVNGEPPYMFAGSNVILILYTDDATLAGKVQAVIEGLS